MQIHIDFQICPFNHLDQNNTILEIARNKEIKIFYIL